MPNPQSPHQLIAGRYRLESVLGRGGMGVVWRATDELMGRTVAVKEVRVPLGLPTEERQRFAERALREARSAGRINHPAVVAIHDVVPASGDDEAVYLVTELVDAPTLADLLDRDGALPPDRVTAIAVRVLDALTAAHSVGVVHRDVKPCNIMVLPGDQVKLLDFGIAHAAGDTRLTRQGMMGSTGYLAPELFHGDDPTPAADLWSVGVTLAQAVTGELPFEGASTAATLHAVLYDDLPAIQCGEPLATVIAGLLTRDATQRLTVEQARDLLDAPVGAGAPGRRDSHAAIGEPDQRGPARPAPEPAGESWERHATTVQPAGPTPPRQRPVPAAPDTPSTEQPAVNFLAEVPRATVIVNIITRFVVVGLVLWVAGLLASLLLMTGRPDWTLFPAILLPLLAGAGLLVSIVSPPHGWVQLTARAMRMHFRRREPTHLLWEHVAAITVGSGAGRSATRSRLGIELTPDAPPDTINRWKARGVLREQDGGGPVWIVGDLDTSPSVLVDELGAVAPEQVRIVGPTDEVPGGSTRAFLPLGRRWPYPVLSCLLLVALVVTGHVFVRQTRSAMVELDADRVSTLAFSPDGATLVSAEDETSSITFWDVADRTATATVPAHTRGIEVLRFSPDGKTLASGGHDGVVKLWDVASRQNTANLTFGNYGSVDHVVFSPQGDSIAVLGGLRVMMWRLSSPNARVDLPVEPEAEPPTFDELRFNQDGQLLVAFNYRGELRAWETASGRQTSQVAGPTAPWAQTTRDSKVLLRTPGSNQVVTTLVGDTSGSFGSTAFGPGDLLVAASVGDIRIWHTTTGRTAHVYKPRVVPSQRVPESVVAISSAGTVALGGYSGLWLWTYDSGR
ncbi:serine/threonine-protein kinase [Micromonospora sp. NPDC048839]|uniref:WD40 repeat domain-containing serine/threonine protein kinase n=1 Tax=Micromonospora sp. NPDC048839 TaxID=3155641 RepID=UPI0033C03E38